MPESDERKENSNEGTKPQTELERFKALASSLLKVPKAEIDDGEALDQSVDVRLENHLRAFIKAEQYDQLFSQGGCFHFAKRAHAAGLGELWCTKSSSNHHRVDHVFLVTKNGMLFDRRGFRSERELLDERQADYGCRKLSLAEVETHISEMRISASLHEDMNRIADARIKSLV